MLEKEEGITRWMFKNWGLGQRVLGDLLQEFSSRPPLPVAEYRLTHTGTQHTAHACVCMAWPPLTSAATRCMPRSSSCFLGKGGWNGCVDA